MKISFEISESELPPRDIEKLKSLLTVSTEIELNNSLASISAAALLEYLQMILGSGLPSRADEIRQSRLFFLVKRYFKGVIPDEPTVSSLFQIPETRSRNLILYTISRFRNDLEDEINNTVKELVKSATPLQKSNTPDYLVTIQNLNALDELNRKIARYAPGLERIKPNISGSRQFIISFSTMEFLKDSLGISK